MPDTPTADDVLDAEHLLLDLRREVNFGRPDLIEDARQAEEHYEDVLAEFTARRSQAASQA